MIDMLLARSVQRLTRDKQINPTETQDHDLHFPHSSSDLLRRDDSVVHRLGVQVVNKTQQLACGYVLRYRAPHGAHIKTWCEHGTFFVALYSGTALAKHPSYPTWRQALRINHARNIAENTS
jgi:hypothetical protein